MRNDIIIASAGLLAFGALAASTGANPIAVNKISEPDLIVTEGEYIVDKETEIGDTLSIEGGTFRMQDKPLRVKGDFYLSANAEFVPGKAPLIFEGDATIHVEKQMRVKEVLVYTGALLHCRGCFQGSPPYSDEVGTFIPRTTVEFITPSLGHVIIE